MSATSLQLAKINQLQKKLEALGTSSVKEKSVMRKDLEQKLRQAKSLFDKYMQSNNELLIHLSTRTDQLLQATETDKSLLQMFNKQMQKDLSFIETTFQTSILNDKKRLSETCQETFDPIDRSIEEERNKLLSGCQNMTAAAEKVAQDLSEDFVKILTEVQQRKEARRKQLEALEKACRSSPEIEEMRDQLSREREEKQKQFKAITSLQDAVWMELQAKMEQERQSREETEEQLFQQLEETCLKTLGT